MLTTKGKNDATAFYSLQQKFYTMDSITHIALGACIGEAMLGRQLGKRAMLLGAVAQSVPDVDFIAGAWMNTASNLLAHRGFTHSILFAILITPLLALLAERWHRPHNISTAKWMNFFALGIFIHIGIDAFNVYGVGWFEPFSHYRVSFNTLFVAEPLFSVWPGLAFTALLLLRKTSYKRAAWVKLGLIMPLLYVLVSIFNKLSIDASVKAIAKKQHIGYNRFFTTPTPLNNFLWYVVLQNDSGYNIGYRSVFDKKPGIDFTFFPNNRSLLQPVSDHEDLQQLIRFSQGYYTAEKKNDTLVFNDLRFGQQTGWQQPMAGFVFHYYLSHPDDNKLVVQRGRFAKWNGDVLMALLKRIGGE
jgi:inner membrane protein